MVGLGESEWDPCQVPLEDGGAETHRLNGASRASLLINQFSLTCMVDCSMIIHLSASNLLGKLVIERLSIGYWELSP